MQGTVDLASRTPSHQHLPSVSKSTESALPHDNHQGRVVSQIRESGIIAIAPATTVLDSGRFDVQKRSISLAFPVRVNRASQASRRECRNTH
jgi:hypothetical protein